ncbi:hypothetical protein [Vibrio crassostreae]|uniref:hypothetical protein n=1 Tax=Vibrio crassostreae TaxID=246167 RepID=UPI001B30F734|nr:hypothetical protein [Vibrio crassostreae]
MEVIDAIWTFMVNLVSSRQGSYLSFYWLAYLWGALLGLYLLYISLAFVGFRLIRILFPYPETVFGFRGLLIYTDTGRESKLFIDKKSGACAKPDAIYRLNNGKYIILEYKSHKTLMDSDLAQLEIGVVAVRSVYPISGGGVVLSDNNKVIFHQLCGKSNAFLLRRNQIAINNVLRFKNHKTIRNHCKTVECRYCPRKSSCEGING